LQRRKEGEGKPDRTGFSRPGRNLDQACYCVAFRILEFFPEILYRVVIWGKFFADCGAVSRLRAGIYLKFNGVARVGTLLQLCGRNKVPIALEAFSTLSGRFQHASKPGSFDLFAGCGGQIWNFRKGTLPLEFLSRVRALQTWTKSSFSVLGFRTPPLQRAKAERIGRLSGGRIFESCSRRAGGIISRFHFQQFVNDRCADHCGD
jgi:hypothetical protein